MLNNEFLLLFILAHLTGDYALQTDKIAKWKSQGIKGILIHVLMVCLAQLVFLSFFGIRGIAAALIGTVIHFLIDYMKLSLGERMKRIELLYYFIDQLLHFSMILLLTLLFADKESHIGDYLPFVKAGIGLILLVYVSTVTAKNVARNLFSEIKTRSFFENNERWIDATVGGFLFGSYLLHPILFLLLFVSGAVMYSRFQKAAYGFGRKISLVKYATLTIFVCLVLALLDRLFCQPLL